MPEVKLGDIARERREVYKGDKSSCPTVGLEHLIPGEVRLPTWDMGGDNTFSKAFYVGDVLFGRRRAYLKKAAQATVEGVCSGDITVIQARPDKVFPDLLPFIIQNDAFFKFAVKNSAGSLSPRVKWEHLAGYEIDLPTMEEQRKLANLLWAAYELKESYKRLLAASDEIAKSRFIELFGDPIENPKGWPRQPISAFAQVKIGPFGSVLHAEDYIHDGYPLVNPSHLHEGKIIVDKTLTISEKKYKELTAYHLHPGDIVIGRRGEIGRCAMVTHEGLFCGTGSLFVRIENCCRPDFLQSVISYPAYKKMLEDKSVGVTMKNINAGMIEDSLIPLPPLAIQNEFAAFIEQLDKSKVMLRESIKKQDDMIHILLTEKLGGIR